jgi:hypothetical protein
MRNISYLGGRLGKTQLLNFLFTFAYSLTPLSTTALFVAVGVAEVKIQMVLLGFALGRTITYTLLGLSADVLFQEVSEMGRQGFTWQNILPLFLTSLVFLLFVFIDWKTLLEERRFRLHFRIWRWNKS